MFSLAWVFSFLLAFQMSARGGPSFLRTTRKENSSGATTNTMMLMWTTSSETFTELNRACIESLIITNPEVEITVISNTLDEFFFRSITTAGIKVLKLSDELLRLLAYESGSVSAVAWVECLEEWRKGPYYYTHVTDFLRFAWILARGGSYSDFDVIWTNSFEGLNNAVGKDHSGTIDCDWCLDGTHYAAPGVMLHFRPHLPSLIQMMNRFFEPKRYKPTVFNSVGPKPLTFIVVEGESGINVLDRVKLFPWNYKESPSMFRFDSALTYFVQKVQMQSIAVHLFGHVAGKLTPHVGSVVGELVRKYGPRCDDDRPRGLEHVGKLHYGITSPFFKVQGQRVTDCVLPHDTRYALVVRSSCGCPLSFFNHLGAPSTMPLGMVRRESMNLRKLNLLLSSLEYRSCNVVEDELLFEVVANDGRMVSWRVHLYDLKFHVTFGIHTMGQVESVKSLLVSLRRFYPFIEILIVDDGVNSSEDEYSKIPFVTYRHLPHDSGRSACRNHILDEIKTPFVAFIDDDFVITAESDVGYLVDVLTKNINVSLAAFKSPVDQDNWNFDLVGMFRLQNKEIHIISGTGECEHGCCHVEIVPNAFLARADDLRLVRWDPDLKLGEHVDLFLRLKKADLRAIFCPAVSVQKNNREQNGRSSSFGIHQHDRMRLKSFLKKMLQKHYSLSLWIFGSVVSSSTSNDGPPDALCPFGFSGPRCLDCKYGFRGTMCNSCDKNHGGQMCQPCFCSNGGICAPITESDVCICRHGYFGSSCELRVQDPHHNVLVNSEWSVRSFDGSPIGWDSSPCCQAKDGELFCPTQTERCHWSTRTVFNSQTAPKALLIEAESLWVGRRHIQSPLYCIRLDVHLADGTFDMGVNINFEYGRVGWQRRRHTYYAKSNILSVTFSLVSASPVKWRNVRLNV